MIQFFIYEDVRRLMEERVARSLANYQRSLPPPEPPLPRDASTDEGDVIEVVFGTACEPDRIGA